MIDILNYIARWICIIAVCLFGANAYADSFPACLIKNPCNCECSDIHQNWPTTVKTFHGLHYPSKDYPVGSPPPGAQGAPSPSNPAAFSHVLPDPADTTNPPKHIPFLVDNQYTSNCICPPYNKASRSGCLLQRNVASLFNLAYVNLCAEESPLSNYFQPKIRYRSQVCNLGCWTQVGDLNGSGDCAYIPTPLGVPLIRLCARVASPANPITPSAADEGYTPDVHLDFEGYVVDDMPLSNGGYDAKGFSIKTPDPFLQVPKVCLYHDPSLIDSIMSPLMSLLGPVYSWPSLTQKNGSLGDMEANMLLPDFMDYNPVSSANHHADGVSPIFRFLITVIKSANVTGLISSMLNSLPSYLQYALEPLKILTYLVGWVVHIVDAGLIAILEFIGTLNRVVIGSFGCANMPLGPFPPPYCTPLQENLEIPVIYPICATTVLSDNKTVLHQMSTYKDPCNAGICTPNLTKAYIQNPDYSDITIMPGINTVPVPFGLCIIPPSGGRNNVIHNSVRVGFNNYKPICPPPSAAIPDPTATGACVYIEGLSSASLLHVATGNTDRLEICGTTPPAMGATPCVHSTYLQNQCRTNPALWHCANGVRLSYSIGTAANNIGTDYFDAGLSDCPKANGTCQSVWGVNIGAFADLSVSFPTSETSYNTSKIQSASVALPDLSGKTHYFAAIVARTKTQIDNSAMAPQEPNQICVYEVDSNGASPVTIGCNDRASAPKPSVYDCALSGLCQSTYFAPSMVASLSVPYAPNPEYTGAADFEHSPWLVDSTQGAVSIPVAYGTTGNTVINLAGYNYSAYGTTDTDSQDFSYLKIPYTDPHAFLNSASRYGNYTGGGAPYDGTGSPVKPMPQYIDGIEYLNNKYQVGATQICLTGYKFDDCATGNTRKNCVLTSLLNNTIIPCSTFAGIVAQNGGMNVCPQTNSFLTCDSNRPIATYHGNGNNVVSILSCVGTNSALISTKCYSYTAPAGTDTTQPLCVISTDASNRLVPSPMHGDTLADDLTPNVDYYNYTPGITSSSSAHTALSTQTNVGASGAVVTAAQNKYNNLVSPSYLPSVCVSNQSLLSDSTSVQYQQIMAACNKTRAIQENINSICSAAGAPLANACTTARNNITQIISNQFNSNLVSQIQAAQTNAQTELSNLQAAAYTPTTCVQNQIFVTDVGSPIYTQVMNSCAAARTVQANVASICNAATAAASNPSGLYNLVSATCSAIQNNITAILADQYNAQLVTQIQNDAGSARTQLSNLMSSIKSFTTSDTILGAIMSTSKSIATSTDLATYPTPASQISAICSQTLSTIATPTTTDGVTTYADNFTASGIFASLQSACNTALSAQQNAATLTVLNSTIQGFSKYQINPPSNVKGQVSVNGAVAIGGYIEPNFDTMNIRNRTDMENGLCVEVPQPTCSAIANGGSVDGYASWDKANITDKVTGRCNNGYATANGVAPTRYCYVKSPNQLPVGQAPTTSFGPVTNPCLGGIVNIVNTDTFPANGGWGHTCHNTLSTNISANSGTMTFGAAGNCANDGTYTSTLTFDVKQLSNLSSFVLNQVGIDDYLSVTVNGTLVYRGQGHYGPIYKIGDPSVPQWKPSSMNQDMNNFYTDNPNINLLPYLVDGPNSIVFNLHIVGGGGLSYKTTYTLKNQ